MAFKIYGITLWELADFIMTTDIKTDRQSSVLAWWVIYRTRTVSNISTDRDNRRLEQPDRDKVRHRRFPTILEYEPVQYRTSICCGWRLPRAVRALQLLLYEEVQLCTTKRRSLLVHHASPIGRRKRRSSSTTCIYICK
jgi:hypothetical protein